MSFSVVDSGGVQLSWADEVSGVMGDVMDFEQPEAGEVVGSDGEVEVFESGQGEGGFDSGSDGGSLIGKDGSRSNCGGVVHGRVGKGRGCESVVGAPVRPRVGRFGGGVTRTWVKMIDGEEWRVCSVYSEWKRAHMEVSGVLVRKKGGAVLDCFSW
jgi:hypothetical protein